MFFGVFSGGGTTKGVRVGLHPSRSSCNGVVSAMLGAELDRFIVVVGGAICLGKLGGGAFGVATATGTSLVGKGWLDLS